MLERMDTRRVYARLRRHLDSLPVGFPRSRAGSRILRRLFSPEEARIALGLSWRFRAAAEIGRELGVLGIRLEGPESVERLEEALKAMASRGSILMRATDGSFALLPFVVGMYELQVASLSEGLVSDTVKFMNEGYGLELLSTGEAQTRVIPIDAAISPEHRIADYDETRSLIRAAGGRIAVVDCICRRATDLVGKPCASTGRRELCMAFRDFADTVLREGWGRALSQDEALELADQNQREGLVMRPSNEREPQFLCACCGDCCGLLAVVKAMKRPADFVASNHRASVKPEACSSCGACARKCPMQAIVLDGPPARRGGRRTARVREGRCIGCGVCVAACKFGAIVLETLEPALVPPRDTGELMERLAQTRPGTARKLLIGLAGLLGIRVRPHGKRAECAKRGAS